MPEGSYQPRVSHFRSPLRRFPVSAKESPNTNSLSYDDKPSYDKLFVFGDSFADAGNLPKGDLKWETRGWYEPSGMSDADHDNKPTGRSSDGLVQSDFLGTYVSSQIDLSM